MQRNYTMTVDISKFINNPPTYDVIQGDTANCINFILYNKQLPLKLFGLTATITILKADGNVVVGNPIAIDTNVLQYKFGTNDTASIGVARATLELFQGADRLTTTKFNLNIVQQLNNGNAVQSTTEYPILNQMIADVRVVQDGEVQIQSNEEQRKINEDLRNVSEQQRIMEENNRILAEQQRVNEFNTLMSAGLGTGNMNSLVYDTNDDGIVNSADTLNGMVSTVTQIDQTVADKHTHSNKNNLDRLDIDVSNNLTIDGTPLTIGGVGDMLKSTYDTDNDGVIDVAETANSVEWINVQSKPVDLADFSNNAGYIKAVDIPPIPSTTSALTNDSDFITTNDVTPLIPTLNSQLVNDSDYATITQVNQMISGVSSGGSGNMHTSTYDIDQDGIVDIAKESQKLTGLIASATQLDQAVAQMHSHSKSDIDITNAVNKAHSHTNDAVINDLTDNGGQLLYKGLSVSNSLDATQVKTLYESNPNTFVFDSAYKNKIDTMPTNFGDMVTSVYDPTNSGKVISAQIADNLTGLLATLTELNFLQGVTNNVQGQINSLMQGMEWKGEVGTYSLLSSTYPTPSRGYTVIVTVDETHSGNRTFYTHDGTTWVYLGEFTVALRDFLLQPINLATETTGVLQEIKVDPLIARKSEIPVFTNKTTLDKLGTEPTSGKLIFDGKPIGGTVVSKTLIGLNATPSNPYLEVMPITTNHAFVNVMKMMQGLQDQIGVINDFNVSDKADTTVATDNRVSFDGKLKIVSIETKPMTETNFGTGKMLSLLFDRSDLKKIEKLQIQ